MDKRTANMASRDNIRNRNKSSSKQSNLSNEVQDENLNCGVPFLIDQLCTKLCTDLHEESSAKKNKVIRSLKALSHQIILKKSHHVVDGTLLEKDDLIASLANRIYTSQFTTWSKKKYQELQNLVERLSELMADYPSLVNVLQFLILMSNPIRPSSAQSKFLGFDSKFSEFESIRPITSLTTMSSSNDFLSRAFSHVPSILDDRMLSGRGSSNGPSKVCDIRDLPFNAPPGSGLNLFEKFCSAWSSSDKNLRNLCDVPNQQKMRSVSIPELNPDVPRSITIPSLRSSHLDEGYVTPDKELLEDRDSCSASKANSPDVWNHLTTQNLTENLRYTWENLGKAEMKKEPPFLSQAGSEVIECWKKHSRMLNKCSSTVLGNSSCSTLSQGLSGNASNMSVLTTLLLCEFFRDVRYLLIGINSSTFRFDEDLNTFVIRPGVSLPGLTPEAVEIYSRELISCGNNFRLLSLLIKTNERTVKPATFDDTDSNQYLISDTTLASSANDVTVSNRNASFVNVHKGLVYEAMCSSISNWLQVYRGMTIKMIQTENYGLLDLITWLHPLQQELEFLVQLCCPPIPNFTLPVGGALLSRIYDAVEITVSAPFSYVLYHVLENCLRVYFRFLEKWLFEGVCDDPYGEFFIEMKNSDEVALDRSYWRKTFTLKSEKVPSFLSSIVDDIFVCGKTLNLIKFCNSEDPFCQGLENNYPRMSPCLEQVTLDKQAEDFNNYVLLINSQCSKVDINEIFSLGSDSEDKITLELLANQRAKSLATIKEAQLKERRSNEEKKKQKFEEMKQDMLDAEQRKKDERQKQLERERKALDAVAQNNLVEAARIEEEKRKIVQYYKSLSDAAEHRRIRAEWKMKRLRLENSRIEFLIEEKRHIHEELLKLKSALSDNKSSEKIDNILKENPLVVTHSASSTDGESFISCPSFVSCPSAESCLNYLSLPGSSPRTVNSSTSVDVEEFRNENQSIKPKISSSDTNICRNNLKDEINSNLDNRNVSRDDTNFNNNKNNNYDNNSINSSSISSERVVNITNASKLKINYSKGSPTVKKGKKKSKNTTTEISEVIHGSRTEDNVGDDTKNLNVDTESVVRIKKAVDNITECLIDTVEKTELENNNKYINESATEKQQRLNKLFSDARHEALLNKQKVFEDEYGMNDAVKVDKIKLDEISSCKDKVLEIKLKTNESAIKERTQQLELAYSDVLETRKEAARNRAKVMSNEYNFFIDLSSIKSASGNELKTSSHKAMDEKITLLTDNDDSLDKSSQDIMLPPSTFPSDASLTITLNEDYESDGKKLDKSFSVTNCDYVDSEGNFLLNKKPLIVDIADKYLMKKLSTLSQADCADVTTIHNCLFKSVVIPTEVQKTFTNDAILRLFLINEKLIEHLYCIRKHFFLLDGEFGRTLTRQIFTDLETVEHPSALLTHLRLNAILRCASRTLNNESPFIERLSFFVKETPLAFLLTDPEVLNCLSLRYRTHWPLNVILTEEAIVNYDKIFAFQLKLQHTAWVLEQDIQILKMPNMMRSTHYRQLQIFRHTMTQFVRALSNYVTAIALEDSWIEFKNALHKVDTLDALYASHVDYVKMTVFRCLLNKRSEPLQKTLFELLRNILTFHELLRNGEWVYDVSTGNHTHSAFSRLLHQHSTFSRLVKYLLKYLQQLIYRGYQPHLDLLIIFLTGNDFYFR